MVVYFDDIFIYNKIKAYHLTHLEHVFIVLQHNKLYLNLKKCDLISSELLFLDFMVNKEGIKTDPMKFQAIKNWKTLSPITKVRHFHGLATF